MVEHMLSMQETQVQFLHPSWRARQAVESISPTRQSLASYLWRIRYAKNSNKPYNGDVTGARSSKSMNNRMTMLQ